MQWRVDVCPIWPLFQSGVSVAGSTFAHARANRSVKRKVWVLLQYLSFWWLLSSGSKWQFSHPLGFHLSARTFSKVCMLEELCLRMCQFSLFTRVLVSYDTPERISKVSVKYSFNLFICQNGQWLLKVCLWILGEFQHWEGFYGLSTSLSPILLISTRSGDSTVWRVKIQPWCGFWSVKEVRNWSWQVQ